MAVIIGFETADGKPVRMTKKQKEKFLKMSNMKADDVIFADNIPSSIFIGGSLITKGSK